MIDDPGRSNAVAPTPERRDPITPTVRLDRVTVTNPSGNALLDDVTLTVPAGHTLGVSGASGAGKTTLIRLLSADPLTPLTTTGSITVGETDLSGLSARRRRHYRRRRLGVVHQHPASALNPTQRVATAVLELLPRSDRTHETAAALLADVDLPTEDEFLRRRTHQLSGGQQQRLAIARTLANRPHLVLLDEPTAELDQTTRDLVVDLLRRRTRDATTILVAHDHHVIAALSDRTVSLDNGRLSPVTTAVTATPSRATGAEIATASATPVAMALRSVSTSHTDAGGTRRPITTDLDLTIRRGETVAIMGRSGTGKTTLARAITGLHKPDHGTIELHGKPLPASIDTRSQAQRRAVQLVPQDPSTTLPPTKRILDIVARPAIRLRGLDTTSARRHAADLLNTIGLDPTTHHRRPHTLSGGERQRVAIARALAASPDLLICDEITSALDPDTTKRLLDLLTDLRQRNQLSLILITHDPEVATRLADRTIELTTNGSEA